MMRDTKHRLIYAGWGVALAALALILLRGAIDAFAESRVNTSGGYVPIYAGHGDNREWVDDELVGPERYRKEKHREGFELSFFSVLAGIVSIVCFIESGPGHRGDRYMSETERIIEQYRDGG